MAVNSIPISRRSLPFNTTIEANGSYTLPQFAFIPHPSLQQLSGPMVNGPTQGGIAPATFAAPPNLQARPYPTTTVPSVYGVRVVNQKVSP